MLLPTVVSDWGGTHSTQLASWAGLDMEMNSAQYFSAEKLREANVSEGTIDGMVRRTLRSMFAAGLFERKDEAGGEGSMDRDARSDEHRKLAHKLAVAGTILLRNEGGILPISSASLSPVSSLRRASPERDGVMRGGGEQARSVRIAIIGDEFTGIGEREYDPVPYLSLACPIVLLSYAWCVVALCAV